MAMKHDISGGGGDSVPLVSGPTVEQFGCTLEEYAKIKKLPIDFLRSLGISTIDYCSQKALRILYYDAAGKELAVRMRIALEGRNKFRLRKGDKLTLYIPQLLPTPYEYGVLVEGESDCHTLWYHGIAAFGLPGASTWKEAYAAVFDDIEILYIIIEPDQGGETVLGWLQRSQIRHKAKLIWLDGFKDPSAMHIDSPEQFTERWTQSIASAQPYQDYEHKIAAEARGQAWEDCKHIAILPDILGHFLAKLKAGGMVGQEREAKLLFLIFVSRFLGRPISCKIYGPSSGGKSYLLECVQAFIPKEAYYSVTAMSEKALAYSDEQLQHRILIIAEASALQSEFGSYLIRTLLSEGRIKYEFVEKTPAGIQSRVIAKEGPTGFITTTTAASLHPENETRLLTLPIIDTKEQTSAILIALANNDRKAQPDYSDWHALQIWLGSANHRVMIPYGNALARLVPPAGLRLRRDFQHVLNVINAHAILHQETREVDSDGRIIATLDDYKMARDLLHDLIAVQLEVSVSKTVRETVEAVKCILEREYLKTVSQAELQSQLGLDRSAISTRVKQAIKLGLLVNEETGSGKKAKLVIGDPMPEGQRILPTVEELQKAFECSGANGVDAIPPTVPPVIQISYNEA